MRSLFHLGLPEESALCHHLGREKTMPSAPARVKRLVVQWDPRATSLPKQIGLFPTIEYLAVPGALVHTLATKMLPRTLRVLFVQSDESTTYALNPKLRAPQLESLIGFTKLAFRADQIPNVKCIAVKLASKKMAGELLALPLGALGVGSISSADAIRAFAKLDLEALALRGGSVKSLDGIESFPHLVELQVKNLPQRADVSALEKCPKLKDVMIDSCPKARPAAWKSLVRALRKRSVTLDWST
jgi:hypothetical protein